MTGESCCDFHHLLTNIYTNDLWMLVHISVAPALPYELVCCSPSMQLACPAFRDVIMWFRPGQNQSVCDNVNTVTFMLAGVCDSTN